MLTRLDTLESVDISDALLARRIMYGPAFNSDLVRASALYRQPAIGRVPYLRLHSGSLWAVRLIPQTSLDTRAAQLAYLSHRDGWSCFYCGRDLDPSTATVEHIVCTAHGGPTHADNLCLACGPCNAAMGALPGVQKMRLAIGARVGAVAVGVFKTQSMQGRKAGAK